MAKFDIDVSKIKKLILYVKGNYVIARSNLDKDTDVIALTESEP